MIVDVEVVDRGVVVESPSEQLAEEAGTLLRIGHADHEVREVGRCRLRDRRVLVVLTTRAPEPERDALRVADLEEAAAVGCRLVVDDDTTQLGDETRGRGHVVDGEAELQRRRVHLVGDARRHVHRVVDVVPNVTSVLDALRFPVEERSVELHGAVGVGDTEVHHRGDPCDIDVELIVGRAHVELLFQLASQRDGEVDARTTGR